MLCKVHPVASDLVSDVLFVSAFRQQPFAIADKWLMHYIQTFQPVLAEGLVQVRRAVPTVDYATSGVRQSPRDVAWRSAARWQLCILRRTANQQMVLHLPAPHVRRSIEQKYHARNSAGAVLSMAAAWSSCVRRLREHHVRR